MGRKKASKAEASLADVVEAVRRIKAEGLCAPRTADSMESAVFAVAKGLEPRNRTVSYVSEHLDEILARRATETGLSTRTVWHYGQSVRRALLWFTDPSKKPERRRSRGPRAHRDWSSLEGRGGKRSAGRNSIVGVVEALHTLEKRGDVEASVVQQMESTLWHVATAGERRLTTVEQVSAHLDESLARYAAKRPIAPSSSSIYRLWVLRALEWAAELRKNPDWRPPRTRRRRRLEEIPRAAEREFDDGRSTLWLTKAQQEALKKGEEFRAHHLGRDLRFIPLPELDASKSAKETRAGSRAK